MSQSKRTKARERAGQALYQIDVAATDLDEALSRFWKSLEPVEREVAGFADWRLCGLISRAIRDGSYGPDAGEALLLPSGGRIAVPRLFSFGLPEPARDGATFAAQ